VVEDSQGGWQARHPKCKCDLHASAGTHFPFVAFSGPGQDALVQTYITYVTRYGLVLQMCVLGNQIDDHVLTY
jgi:hypothetical protein